MWQQVKLSEQIRPRDTLACCWDVKQPTTKHHNGHLNHYATQGGRPHIQHMPRTQSRDDFINKLSCGGACLARASWPLFTLRNVTSWRPLTGTSPRAPSSTYLPCRGPRTRGDCCHGSQAERGEGGGLWRVGWWECGGGGGRRGEGVSLSARV